VLWHFWSAFKLGFDPLKINFLRQANLKALSSKRQSQSAKWLLYWLDFRQFSFFSDLWNWFTISNSAKVILCWISFCSLWFWPAPVFFRPVFDLMVAFFSGRFSFAFRNETCMRRQNPPDKLFILPGISPVQKSPCTIRANFTISKIFSNEHPPAIPIPLVLFGLEKFSTWLLKPITCWIWLAIISDKYWLPLAKALKFDLITLVKPKTKSCLRKRSECSFSDWKSTS